MDKYPDSGVGTGMKSFRAYLNEAEHLAERKRRKRRRRDSQKPSKYVYVGVGWGWPYYVGDAGDSGEVMEGTGLPPRQRLLMAEFPEVGTRKTFSELWTNLHRPDDFFGTKNILVNELWHLLGENGRLRRAARGVYERVR
jgi:hypothetical protein